MTRSTPSSFPFKAWLPAAVLLLATAGAVLAWAREAPPLTPTPPAPPGTTGTQERPRIEAVFVLDTTGSMGGLIQAAKENIWSIATSMAQAQPTPELSIGLVAFRDRGDEYVTRVIPLSTDLDRVYAQLMDFQAAGGGDHPEAVNQALYDAVHRAGWSQHGGAYRTIFLIGDAPPKRYDDDVPMEVILASAAERGIVVNTIQAGDHADTRRHWQQIAATGQGAYFAVGQHGSAVAVTTPFDDRIAALARELDGTRMFYGDRERQRTAAERSAATGKLHAAASPAAQARRAAFNLSEAGRDNLLGEDELVDAVATGRVSLDAVPEAHLPPAIAAMAVEERKQAIETAAARREQLTAELAALGRQRQQHIAEAIAAEPAPAASLDRMLFDTVKGQAEARGLRYEAAAPVH